MLVDYPLSCNQPASELWLKYGSSHFPFSGFSKRDILGRNSNLTPLLTLIMVTMSPESMYDFYNFRMMCFIDDTD